MMLLSDEERPKNELNECCWQSASDIVMCVLISCVPDCMYVAEMKCLHVYSTTTATLTTTASIRHGMHYASSTS